MKNLVIASLRPCAGKTSIILGLAGAMEKSFGYMKPFGERVLYRKKRLLDYDSALVKNLFELDEDPEDMSLGFDHSKLRFMYDMESIKERIGEMAAHNGQGKEVLLVEAGKDLMYGSSVNLDAFTLTETLDARLVLVISGEDDTIVDDLTFLKEHISIDEDRFAGIIINKVKDIEDFQETNQDKIDSLDLKIIGLVPFQKELTYLSMNYVSEVLFAKVLAGEENMENNVEEIYIGAMSGDAAVKNPLFSRSGKLIITSGDREDMCLAALSSNTAGIILTNNILPSTKIINMAKENKVPLLLVPGDTFRTAKQIDDMERLITKEDHTKKSIIIESINKNVDLDKLI